MSALAARCVAVVLALLGALAVAPPAHAGTIFAPEDAVELSNILADAAAEQGVCYGWNITGSGQFDQGSNFGPDRPVDPTQCDKYVQLDVEMDYACSSCDSSDSASYGLTWQIDKPPTLQDIEDLGYDSGDLTGDNDDVAIFNMVSALPLLTAERGGADFIEYETAPAAEVPQQDKPTNSPGSDFLRAHWLGLTLSIFLLLCGPLYWLYKRSRPAPTRRGSGGGKQQRAKGQKKTISIPSNG